MVEVTKHVQPKIFDRKFLQLWTIQAPISLSTRTNWYTSSADKVSSVGCSYSIYLSRYSLISTHPGENNSTRTAVVLIPNTLRWNAHMFYHFWCRTNATLMRTSTNNSLFSSNCTTWLIDVHHNWSEENIFKVLHIVPLDLQFCHMQRHVRWHLDILNSHIHQRHLRTMDACTTHDGCDGRESVRGPNKNALIIVSTAVFNESAIWVMSAHSTKFFHWRSGSAIPGLSLNLLPSSLARRLLLDDVYWTFTIIFKFEDDLGSSFQFQKLIYTTSFKLRANNQHMDWVNPTAADLRDVCHMAWVSLYDINHDIWPWKWPWIMSPISEIDSHKII